MEDPDSFPPPPMYPPPPGMEGAIPPPPPPRFVGKYPPPPPYKPAGLPTSTPPPQAYAPPGAEYTEYSEYSAATYQGEQQEQEYEEDPTAMGLPTSFAHNKGYKPYASQPYAGQQEESQFVEPEYNVHPLLKKPDDAVHRPYKRKGAPSSPTSSSSFSSAFSTSTDDDIKPNLLYQQRKPEPYQAYNKRVVPSREEESVGTYHTKKNPFEQYTGPTYTGGVPGVAGGGAGGGMGRGAGGGVSGGMGRGAGRGGEVRSSDGVVGVAPYKRRTFTVEESREKAKKQQQQESAVSITNNVVASIREKLASGGKISKGQAKILNRDQDIISSIAMPTYVAHRTGSGLTPEEIQKAQDEHTRKLLGWKYHVAVKARNEQALEAKRQKK